MKTIKKIILASSIAGVCLMSTLAMAGHGKQCGHHGMFSPMAAAHGATMEPEHWLKHIGRKLELSKDQKVEVKRILADVKRHAKPLRQVMHANILAERAAMDEGVAAESVLALAQKSAESRVNLMLLGRASQQQIRQVLSEEQNLTLDNLKSKHRQKMSKRMAKWHS